MENWISELVDDMQRGNPVIKNVESYHFVNMYLPGEDFKKHPRKKIYATVDMNSPEEKMVRDVGVAIWNTSRRKWIHKSLDVKSQKSIIMYVKNMIDTGALELCNDG